MTAVDATTFGPNNVSHLCGRGFHREKCDVRPCECTCHPHLFSAEDGSPFACAECGMHREAHDANGFR